MTVKKDKNTIDDYYSNLSGGDDQTIEKKNIKVVKKIKIKPKKIVVKSKIIKEEDIVDKVIEKENTIIENQNLTSSSKIKKDEEQTDFTKSIKEKVIPTKVEKEKVIPTKVEKEKPVINDKKDTPKNGYKKTFKDNLTPKSGNNENKKQKRAKLFPYKVNKYKIGAYTKESTFVRSSKIKKNKKEEKKVEDIKQNLISHKGEVVVVGNLLTLKEFSEKIGITLPKLIAEFMKNGLIVNINSPIDFDTASLIAESFEIKLEKDSSAGVSVQDLLEGNFKELFKEDDLLKLVKKIPVVSIMGHVDHGKTSLLDYIRKDKIVDTEAGGITQSIGAYQVEHNNESITFLDTPGHEAFTIMRARGAKSTDIAILVVAADEGVKPQTIESINHAKEAGIPIIVAINKMDKEGANPDHVKGQLSEHGLTPEDWGGDTPMIPVSAMTGFGIDSLLEIILLVSEMLDLKANPDRDGIATVIESHLDSNLGSIATVIINTGTINKGDNVVCKNSYGKVKILKNYSSKNIKKAGPGTPVLIVGLNNVVEGGDILQIVSSADVARDKAIEYNEIISNKKKLKSSGLEMLMLRIKTGNLKQLKIVVKSDTNGSLEAIKNSLLKLSTNETNVLIIHSGVGNITEGDVLMCEGSSAILIGFNVGVVPTAKRAIENSKIEYINSKIIYHVTERIEKIVTGMLDIKEVEIILTRAKVLKTFYSSKKFMVLGLNIPEDEYIEPNTKVKVIRNDKIIGTGEIISLKSGVEEVKKIEGPTECGIKFSGNVLPEEKDILEVYKIEIQ